MTAEIAVMNEEAIALAADSAVSGPKKIFTSANKIFALSKYHPVGVMVFANAQFLNVPWETIIKQYRRELGDRAFPTLSEHADHFLKFFNGPNKLFPADAQERAILSLADSMFHAVIEDTEPRLRLRTTNGEELTEQQVAEELEQTIDQQLKRWISVPHRTDVPNSYVSIIRKRYGAQIDIGINRLFDGRVSEGAKNKLKRLVPKYLACTDFLFRSFLQSGIVIAGFGREDVFPRLRRFKFQTIAANRLKFKEGEAVEIGYNNRAVISPFAQDEEVRTFIQGVDPRIGSYQGNWWPPKLLELLHEVGEHLNMTEEEQIKLLTDMAGRATEIQQEYEQDLAQFQQEKNVSPILNVVEMLPKDELAAMAESLVNLTRFKRRVTEEEETVGGPIDVAVISRGDGFIWIKRKHYFKPELNPQFLANYYRSEDDDE